MRGNNDMDNPLLEFTIRTRIHQKGRLKPHWRSFRRPFQF